MSSRAEEIARKHHLSRFVPGDDGFGGEDEPLPEAIAALNEMAEWAAQQCEAEKAGWTDGVVCNELERARQKILAGKSG